MPVVLTTKALEPISKLDDILALPVTSKVVVGLVLEIPTFPLLAMVIRATLELLTIWSDSEAAPVWLKAERMKNLSSGWLPEKSSKEAVPVEL